MSHAEGGRTGGAVLARDMPGVANSIGRKPDSESKRSGDERLHGEIDNQPCGRRQDRLCALTAIVKTLRGPVYVDRASF